MAHRAAGVHKTWPSFWSRFRPPQHAHKDKQEPTFGSKNWGRFFHKIRRPGASPAGRIQPPRLDSRWRCAHDPAAHIPSTPSAPTQTKQSQHTHPTSLQTTGIAIYGAMRGIVSQMHFEPQIQRVEVTQTGAFSPYSVTKDSMCLLAWCAAVQAEKGRPPTKTSCLVTRIQK